ncbi:MAG TPA: deoxyribodipyrimidine photo-lyase [Bacteroidia bacterium]|nr:deoxyribodipyrimidine photo-lyase [Bacteroidia bacterium]
MNSRNRILFWFRENLFLNSNPALYTALVEGNELIPVYCFDPREFLLLPNETLTEDYANQQINNVSLLRHNLQLKGSNLLIVTDPYEKIIPSLARILDVHSVVSDIEAPSGTHTFEKISTFRHQKAMEVKGLLNMHSIPVHFVGCHDKVQAETPIFPTFPEINPGQIPTREHFLHQLTSYRRSIAC